MNSKYEVFLALFSAALTGEKPQDPGLELTEWEQLLRLAAEQEILPLFFNEAVNLPSFRTIEREIRLEWQRKALSIAMRQVKQTNEFLTLVLHAQRQDLNPIVLKGLICRNLYPQPMLRPSVDEDLLILLEETEAYHGFLLAEGLFADEPEADRDAEDELSYHRENSPTYIELHKALFSRSSAAYGDLNALFTDAPERTVELKIDDVTLRTLCPTDHFLYLVCHAYKHFLHSGVGIRQAADMALFANTYGAEIDWYRILEDCRAVHIEFFTAALLRIAQKYLTLREIPAPFSEIDVEEQPLLLDMLSGGLYGVADIDRLHSGNMTLDAVAAQKQGRHGSGVWHSLFPGKDYLKSKFSYAKKYPILLPVAWAQRIGRYLTQGVAANPAETIRIGQERIALLRQYHIIENN